jgi:hypothetical protein
MPDCYVQHIPELQFSNVERRGSRSSCNSLGPLLIMMSFICSCRNKNQPQDMYPKGTSHHTSLFTGSSTNDMKK